MDSIKQPRAKWASGSGQGLGDEGTRLNSDVRTRLIFPRPRDFDLGPGIPAAALRTEATARGPPIASVSRHRSKRHPEERQERDEGSFESNVDDGLHQKLNSKSAQASVSYK